MKFDDAQDAAHYPHLYTQDERRKARTVLLAFAHKPTTNDYRAKDALSLADRLTQYIVSHD